MLTSEVEVPMVANDHSSVSSMSRWPEILSRREAAAYLGVSDRTFDRIKKEKAIPWVLIGRRRKYLLRDIEAYLMSQRSV